MNLLRQAAAANARHPASLLARHPAVLQTRSAKTRTRSNSSGILRNLRFGKNAACSSVSKRYFLVGSADGRARHFGSCGCTTTHEGGGDAPRSGSAFRQLWLHDNPRGWWGSPHGRAWHFGSCGCTTTHKDGGDAPTGRLGTLFAVFPRKGTELTTFRLFFRPISSYYIKG